MTTAPRPQVGRAEAPTLELLAPPTVAREGAPGQRGGSWLFRELAGFVRYVVTGRLSNPVVPVNRW